MTLLEEFAALAAELGLGTYRADGTPGGTIFLAGLPSTPDEAIAIGRYGGSEADTRLPYDEPRLQFRVRGISADVRTAEARAQAVYDALHGLGMRTLPGGTWLQLAVAAQGGPIYIGPDADRPPRIHRERPRRDPAQRGPARSMREDSRDGRDRSSTSGTSLRRSATTTGRHGSASPGSTARPWTRPRTRRPPTPRRSPQAGCSSRRSCSAARPSNSRGSCSRTKRPARRTPGRRE